MSLAAVDDIRAASLGIDRIFSNTPQYRAETLSENLALDVVCKVETQNPIGCFKGRGTDWWMRKRKAEHVVCATAGNLGQGLAYSCRSAGRTAHLFVHRGANARKVLAMARLGARIHETGHDFDAAKAEAAAYAAAHGMMLLDDARDVEIAEGFGTIALELCSAEPKLDAIYLPIGSGALASGCGAWVRSMAPGTRVIGVGAAGAPATQRSVAAGRTISTDRIETIASGVGVRVPAEEAVTALCAVLDEFVLVTDAQIQHAMRMLFACERVVSEPSGAVAMAGLVANAKRHARERVAVVITGANLDEEELSWLWKSA